MIHLQDLVESVKTHSERKHLMFKGKKTKFMKTDKKIGPVNTTVNSDILEILETKNK